MTDNTLWVFAVMLFFGLIIPEFFKKIQLPFATSLIFVGALLGPQGFGYLTLDPSMELFGFLGAAFLMLLAGFEVKASDLRRSRKDVALLFILNTTIPFATGAIIILLFHYSLETAIVTGILFMSSSTALIFSNLKSIHLDKNRVRVTLKSTVVLEDLASLLLLSVLIQYHDPESRFPPIIYFGLLVSSIVILRMFLPEIVIYFFRKFNVEKDETEGRLRVVLAFLLFVVIIYSGMNIHPIIAAFMVGFILSEVEGIEPLKQKLHTIGYGIFVPVFFFIIGVETNFRTFSQIQSGNWLLVFLLIGAVISKVFSGYMGARLEKFSPQESSFVGTATATKLTTTVSTSYAAFLLDLIDPVILTSMVMISVVSTVIGPLSMNFFAKKMLIPKT